MTKKKIAIIIPKLNEGGAERTASNLSILLSSLYDIHMIVFDSSNIVYPYNGTLHNLNLPPANNTGLKIINLLKRVHKTRRIIKENDISCCISLMDGPNLVNIFSKLSNRVLTSVRIHMSSSRKYSGIKLLVQKYSLKLIVQKSNYLIALSDGVRRDLVEYYSLDPKKIIRIYNPVDLVQIKNNINSDEPLIPDGVSRDFIDKDFVITMGRLVEQKGQWHLIRSMKEVVKSNPSLILVVLGGGPLYGRLKELVISEGLQENIIFLGFVDNPHFYIARSKCFIFPSLFEGLGNVLIEALSCGVPCISTDCQSGPREILAPNTEFKGELNEIEFAEYGILVSADNVYWPKGELTKPEFQMASAIQKVVEDKDLYVKYSSQSRIRSMEFTDNSILNSWVKALE